MGHSFNQKYIREQAIQEGSLCSCRFLHRITSDLFSYLNDYMKLEPLPEGMRGKLMLWAALLFCGCHGWERFLGGHSQARCSMGEAYDFK